MSHHRTPERIRLQEQDVISYSNINTEGDRLVSVTFFFVSAAGAVAVAAAMGLVAVGEGECSSPRKRQGPRSCHRSRSRRYLEREHVR